MRYGGRADKPIKRTDVYGPSKYITAQYIAENPHHNYGIVRSVIIF